MDNILGLAEFALSECSYSDVSYTDNFSVQLQNTI